MLGVDDRGVGGDGDGALGDDAVAGGHGDGRGVAVLGVGGGGDDDLAVAVGGGPAVGKPGDHGALGGSDGEVLAGFDLAGDDLDLDVVGGVAEVEADLDGVVVGGAERRVVVEVDDVVVAPRVLEGDGLVGVDVPHPRVLDQAHGRGVAEGVVEGAELAVELVGRLVVVVDAADVGVAVGLQRADGVFAGVGVEVAEEEDGGVGPVGLLGQGIDKRL